MTKEWKDRALILRYGHFHENDIWIRALLSNYGLQTLFAFGGAKSRRRFCGCLDQFNTLACSVRVSRTGEYLNLAEATLLSAPRRLRQDWRRMGIAANCARFTEACAISPESAAWSFLLLENLRDRLERDLPVSGFFPLFFRLRLAGALGFAPSFTSCARCGNLIDDQGYFQVDDGQSFCADCASLEFEKKRRVRLTSGATLILDAIQHSLPDEWDCEATSDADLRIAGRVIDSFIQFHLGLEWENGNFRRI